MTDLTSASRQRTLDGGGLKLDIQVRVMGSHPYDHYSLLYYFTFEAAVLRAFTSTSETFLLTQHQCLTPTEFGSKNVLLEYPFECGWLTGTFPAVFLSVWINQTPTLPELSLVFKQAPSIFFNYLQTSMGPHRGYIPGQTTWTARLSVSGWTSQRSRL